LEVVKKRFVYILGLNFKWEIFMILKYQILVKVVEDKNSKNIFHHQNEESKFISLVFF